MTLNTIISYPHYCHRCYFAFVSAERNAVCPKCGKGDLTHNCYGEVSIIYKLEAKNKQLKDTIANGNEILKSANNDVKRLSQYADKLEAENKQLETNLEDIRNREGACCPEDVGFDEWVRTLRAENKLLKKTVEVLEKQLDNAGK